MSTQTSTRKRRWPKQKRAADPARLSEFQQDVIYWARVCPSSPGEQSLSFLVDSLRQDGWSLPGALHDAERIFQDAGFHIRHTRSKNGWYIQATYVLMYCPL